MLEGAEGVCAAQKVFMDLETNEVRLSAVVPLDYDHLGIAAARSSLVNTITSNLKRA